MTTTRRLVVSAVSAVLLAAWIGSICDAAVVVTTLAPTTASGHLENTTALNNQTRDDGNDTAKNGTTAVNKTAALTFADIVKRLAAGLTTVKPTTVKAAAGVTTKVAAKAVTTAAAKAAAATTVKADKVTTAKPTTVGAVKVTAAAKETTVAAGKVTTAKSAGKETTLKPTTVGAPAKVTTAKSVAAEKETTVKPTTVGAQAKVTTAKSVAGEKETTLKATTVGAPAKVTTAKSVAGEKETTVKPTTVGKVTTVKAGGVTTVKAGDATTVAAAVGPIRGLAGGQEIAAGGATTARPAGTTVAGKAGAAASTVAAQTTRQAPTTAKVAAQSTAAGTTAKPAQQGQTTAQAAASTAKVAVSTSAAQQTTAKSQAASTAGAQTTVKAPTTVAAAPLRNATSLAQQNKTVSAENATQTTARPKTAGGVTTTAVVGAKNGTIASSGNNTTGNDTVSGKNDTASDNGTARPINALAPSARTEAKLYSDKCDPSGKSKDIASCGVNAYCQSVDNCQLGICMCKAGFKQDPSDRNNQWDCAKMFALDDTCDPRANKDALLPEGAACDLLTRKVVCDSAAENGPCFQAKLPESKTPGYNQSCDATKPCNTKQGHKCLNNNNQGSRCLCDPGARYNSTSGFCKIVGHGEFCNDNSQCLTSYPKDSQNAICLTGSGICDCNVGAGFGPVRYVLSSGRVITRCVQTGPRAQLNANCTTGDQAIGNNNLCDSGLFCQRCPEFDSNMSSGRCFKYAGQSSTTSGATSFFSIGSSLLFLITSVFLPSQVITHRFLY